MRTIDLIGVAVFAVSGALAGVRKGLDVLGVTVVAVVTSIGGGTIRDLLLDRHPIFWIADPGYLWAGIIGAVASILYARRWFATRQALLVADALGLAFFAVAGAQVALQEGHSALIAVLMGTITGVAGGVVRDVLLAEIPLVLRPEHLYATAAIAGIAVYLLLLRLPVFSGWAAPAGMFTTALLRILAIRYALVLPMAPVPPDQDHAPPAERSNS